MLMSECPPPSNLLNKRILLLSERYGNKRVRNAREGVLSKNEKEKIREQVVSDMLLSDANGNYSLKLHFVQIN